MPAAVIAEERSELTWTALGSTVVVQLTEHSDAGRARELAVRELAAVDRACSRFRADSELSRVNEHAGRWVPVGPLLAEALQVALRAAATTAGAVDPTIGGALILAGYDRDFALLRDGSRLDMPGDGRPTVEVSARRVGGWRAVELDHEHRRVRIPRGVRLDLGATAKAWAADRCARRIHDDLGDGALVSLGGDIATDGPAPCGGWQIRVTDDHRAGATAPGQTVRVVSGGLATSSVLARRWRSDHDEQHHIIDPASGRPAQGPWRTVSVAAGDCTDANIASTAAIVRGAEAVAWLEGLGLPARLVAHAGAVREVAGWPAAADEHRGAQRR